MNHRRRSTWPGRAFLAAALASATLALGACGTEEGPADPGAANPEPAAGNPQVELADLPPALAELYSEGAAILPGGLEAFEQRLADLRGHPVVVNKWASWCGPCRFEFPFFQAQAAERGAEVAFLGVDSDDSEDAASTFLEDYPVPYPSYSDPDEEIARAIEAEFFPSTVFYDDSGDVVFTKIGPYESERDLAADIERYAG